MIGKIIARKASASKKIAANVRALTTYIRDCKGDLATPGEKVLESGSQNFVCDDFESQVGEMIALATEGCRGTNSTNSIKHYVLAWKEGEQPTRENAEEAVSILLEEMRLSKCQVQWALHGDTDNIHLHVVVNRVDPDSEMLLKPGGGFEKETLHRAIAKIEAAGGWSKEKNARYEIDADGKCVKREKVNADAPKVASKARDMETRTGEKSQIRVGIENAAPLIANAKSWQELHIAMEKIGMRYERNGGGAVIWTGGEFVKASTVCKRADSFDKLQKRLGAFEEKGIKNVFITHAVEAEEQNADDFGHVATNRVRRLSECHLAKNTGEQRRSPGVLSADARDRGRVAGAVRREAGGRDDGESGRGRPSESFGQSGSPHTRSAGDHAGDRPGGRGAHTGGNADAGRTGNRLAGRPVSPGRGRREGRREPLNKKFQRPWETYAAARAQSFAAKKAASALLNASVSAQRQALSNAQKVERTDVLSGDWKGKGLERQAFKSVLAARQAGARADLQDKVDLMRAELAARHKRFPDFETWLKQAEGERAARAWRLPDQAPAGNGIEGSGYVAPKPRTDIRDYVPEADGRFVHYLDSRGQRGFTDVGHRIEIYSEDPAAVRAALQLASAKFGGEVSLTGDLEFKTQAVKLAVEQGIRISNPELATMVADQVAAKKAAELAARQAQAEAERAAAKAKAAAEAQERQAKAQVKPEPVKPTAPVAPVKAPATVAAAKAAPPGADELRRQLKAAEDRAGALRAEANAMNARLEPMRALKARIETAKKTLPGLKTALDRQLATHKSLTAQRAATGWTQVLERSKLDKQLAAIEAARPAQTAAYRAMQATAAQKFDAQAHQVLEAKYRVLYDECTAADKSVSELKEQLRAAIEEAKRAQAQQQAADRARVHVHGNGDQTGHAARPGETPKG